MNNILRNRHLKNRDSSFDLLLLTLIKRFIDTLLFQNLGVNQVLKKCVFGIVSSLNL